MKADHELSLIAFASFRFLTIPLTFKSSIAITSWFLMRLNESLCRKSLRVFIEAAFTFSDEDKWVIGEIEDINLFCLYVFDGSNAGEVKVTNEVATGILDKIRPLMVFDRFFDGTKVIKKQA